MEQYILTLIATDLAFVPRSLQIEKFLGLLAGTFHFRMIANTPSETGIRVLKPSGSSYCVTDPMTGAPLSIPKLVQAKVERTDDVTRTVEGLDNYSVTASGEWTPESRPFTLLTTDEVPYEGSYGCEVSCNVRPEPVSTSCWNRFANPHGPSVPDFGSPCKTENRTGIFSHPWTSRLIEVSDAGCARFWIEFEFGRFLLPKMSGSLDVLRPAMVAEIEASFGTRFVQGWRFN